MDRRTDKHSQANTMLNYAKKVKSEVCRKVKGKVSLLWKHCS